MSSLKRWRTLGGGGGSFYKFFEGAVLEGVWQGTQAGKFGDNGIVETPDGQRHLFRVSVGLKDLLRVRPGGEVRIEYKGKETAKNGNTFSKYVVQVADTAVVSDEDEPPF